MSTCIAVIDDDLASRELAKPFDVDELLVLLQQLARGAPPASPAAPGVGRCAPVCAGD